MVFNITYRDSNGNTQRLNNVAFNDIPTMVAYVQQLPGTLIQYQVVSGGMPAGAGSPTQPIYQFVYRDTAGNQYSCFVTIPSVLPNGYTVSGIQDFMHYLADLDLVYLSNTAVDPNVVNVVNNQILNGPAVVLFQSPLIATTAQSAGVSTAQNINNAVNGTGTNNTGGIVYRFILQTADLNQPSGFSYNTGANYPSCSQSNQTACAPNQFATVDDAIAYAITHNEVPVIVGSSAETWSIISGQTHIPATTINIGGNNILTTNGGTTALQSAGVSTDNGLVTAIAAGVILLALDRFSK